MTIEALILFVLYLYMLKLATASSEIADALPKGKKYARVNNYAEKLCWLITVFRLMPPAARAYVRTYEYNPANYFNDTF